MLYPFELPTWIDEIYDNETSIYHKSTYRNILKILFSKTHTIYKIIDVERISYIQLHKCTTLSFRDRTTYLLSLIDCIDYDDNGRIKFILLMFLTHAENINFFHPNERANSLIYIEEKLQNTRHHDLIDALLQRKEILIPSIIEYLSPHISYKKHIEKVLSLFANTCNRHNIFSNLLHNYITKTPKMCLSRQLIIKLVSRCTLKFREYIDLFLPLSGTRTDIIDFLSCIPWSRLEEFDMGRFYFSIKHLYCQKIYYMENSHGLLQVYNTIVKEYKIILEVPRVFIENILLYHKQPEQILLLECMNKLDDYKNLLQSDLLVTKFIQKRYKIKYGPFIYYWRHRTYSPNSKCFYKLLEKYKNTMYNDTYFPLHDDNIVCNVKEIQNYINFNPYLLNK